MRLIARQNKLLLFLLFFVLWPLFAATHGMASTACEAVLATNIPPRARFAMSGSEFAKHVSGMDERQREQAILAQLLAGNLPAFLRTLQPVQLQHTFEDRTIITATICMMPDYLAIGSNDDFLRIPINLYTATAIAGHFGFILPTKKMVDAIYQQSAYHLRPAPMAPGPQMRSTAYYWAHNQTINKQWLALGRPLGRLLAGHKKDVVMTNRLARKPDKVAIYGWHRGAGRPIQPLSTVHSARYADYSHGTRLVSDVVLIDGEAWSVYEVLRHPKLAEVLSAEGMIHNLRYLMGTRDSPGVMADSLDNRPL